MAAKFRRTNRNYVKVKKVAEDHINSVLAQEDKAKLLSIALNSVVEAFRQNPDACANVVFTDNNGNNRNNNGSGIGIGSSDEYGDVAETSSSSISFYNGGVPPNTNANVNNYNNNTDEYRRGILMLAKNLFNTFMTQTVNQTMDTLEEEGMEAEDTKEKTKPE